MKMGPARRAAPCDILGAMKLMKDVAITPLRGLGSCGGNCGCGCGTHGLRGIYNVAGQAKTGAVLVGVALAGALAVALIMKVAR